MVLGHAHVIPRRLAAGLLINYIAGIKNERGINIEYFVHSTKYNYVVKTRSIGDSNFYCLDTTTESVKPTIIESTTDFTSTKDCKGLELK